MGMQMSLFVVNGQLQLASRLDLKVEFPPTIISGSGAATVNGRAQNILTLHRKNPQLVSYSR